MQFLIESALPPRQGDVPARHELLEFEDAPPPLIFEQRFPFLLYSRYRTRLECALVLRAELELVLRVAREGLDRGLRGPRGAARAAAAELRQPPYPYPWV